jgi:hypothetical protein
MNFNAVFLALKFRRKEEKHAPLARVFRYISCSSLCEILRQRSRVVPENVPPRRGYPVEQKNLTEAVTMRCLHFGKIDRACQLIE